jgi:hypothetical protein
MRTEFVSRDEVTSKVKGNQGGNRQTRIALLAANWQKGRRLLEAIPGGDGTDVYREWPWATVKVLPTPGCIQGDFLDRDEFDELFVVPDGISLVDIHRLTKLLLGVR